MRNVDGRQDSGRGEGCPRWCSGEHDELSAPSERLHRSAARSLPVVLWAEPTGVEEPTAQTLHVSLCRPGEEGEDRLRFEADGLGCLDLDLSSAARLVRGAEAALRLLDVAL